jgi:hypothetical protein
MEYFILLLRLKNLDQFINKVIYNELCPDSTITSGASKTEEKKNGKA